MISCIISVFKASVIKTVLLHWRKKIGTVALAVLCTSPLSIWAHNKNHKSKIMGRASKLSPFEQGCMVELHQQGRSCQDIAAELGRSKTTVNNFLRCPEAYGTKKSTGRPNKLSQRAKNAVLWYDRRSSGLSSRQIAAKNGLDVSKDTISRCLKAEGFHRRKHLCRPRLLERHKVRHLEFARNCLNEWSKILFSDLVAFDKAGSAQALSSTEALGLEALGDGVLADIEAIFGSNLSGGKARASSVVSQDGILRSLGEFIQSACWLLCPVSFRAPCGDVHKTVSATVPIFLRQRKRTVLITEALKTLIIQLIIFFFCNKPAINDLKRP